MIVNLLEETLEKLSENYKSPKDVIWVGKANGSEASTFEEFSKMANFEYDSGFGSEEIRSDLVIVGNDWWLARREYDGSEWWEYLKLPVLSKDHEKLIRIRTWLGD